MKNCKHCGIELTSEVKRNGLSCKTCRNGLGRYGLNRNQQIQLLESQNHKCALCEDPVELHTGSNWNGVIDHDHKTNEVRGVLCGYCNVALGKLEGNKLNNFIKNVSTYITPV